MTTIMALVINSYCIECEQQRDFVNGHCPYCQERRRREELAVWMPKTLEERLLDIHKRLLVIEQNSSINAKYK